LVAGDIVASEDSGGTLKTILTRSLGRGQILACKVLATLAYIVAILAALAIAGIIGGTIAWGFNPLTTSSGTRISALHAFALTFATLGVFALPLLGVAAFAIFLSFATRNSAAAIVGSVVYAVAQEAIGGPRARADVPPLPALDPVRLVAARLPHADRLDGGRTRDLGLCALRRRAARSGPPDLRAPRRRRAVISGASRVSSNADLR
jgi:ABC-2 family transporter protein